MEEKVRENYMRRWAKRLGLFLKKSRAKRWSLNNMQEYMILNSQGLVLDGARFHLSLDDIEEWLKIYEAKIR